jgi:hypothetical protein
MEKSRDSMILYRSFYDAIKLLPDSTQLEILKAIFEYGLDGIEPELSQSAKPFWLLIKPNLQANRTKWESGCKAKHKQSRSKTEAKGKQKVSKGEANVDVDVDVDKDNNVDVDVIINLSDLSAFESKYEKQMLADFQAYWTETNSKGKMRYEAEKFFDIAKRLATWARNQNSFSKNKKNEQTLEVPAGRSHRMHESFTFIKNQ